MTYRWLIYVTLIVLVYGCGAAEMENEAPGAGQPTEEEEQVAAAQGYNEEAEYSEESKKDEVTISIKKWKNKAKQQLESIEDLLLILEDPELDLAFKYEVEKELNVLYENEDFMLDSLMSRGVKFKNFKTLEIDNGDTMSLEFKNQKELLKAKFVVVEESKDFGGTTEIVERLKLVSIEAEK